jgi:hypothetical protein
MTIQNNFTRHFGKFATHPLTLSVADLAAASIAPCMPRIATRASLNDLISMNTTTPQQTTQAAK